MSRSFIISCIVSCASLIFLLYTRFTHVSIDFGKKLNSCFVRKFLYYISNFGSGFLEFYAWFHFGFWWFLCVSSQISWFYSGQNMVLFCPLFWFYLVPVNTLCISDVYFIWLPGVWFRLICEFRGNFAKFWVRPGLVQSLFEVCLKLACLGSAVWKFDVFWYRAGGPVSKYIRFSKPVSSHGFDSPVCLFWVFVPSGSVIFEVCPVWCCQILELACCLQHRLSGLILYQYSCAGSRLVWHVTGCRLCRNRSWMSLFMISFAIYTSWLYCRICCDFRFVLYRPVWLNFDCFCYFRFGWPCGFHAIDLYDLLWFCSSILDFASRPKIGSCVTPPYALAQIWAEFWGD